MFPPVVLAVEVPPESAAQYARIAALMGYADPAAMLADTPHVRRLVRDANPGGPVRLDVAGYSVVIHNPPEPPCTP